MHEKNEVHQKIIHWAQSSLGTLVSPHPEEAPPFFRDAMNWVQQHMLPLDAQKCVSAGLWLLNGELEKAHVICQDVATAHGSAWHAVVHRMEGDFWNSKYWWRRAGVAWARLEERIAEEIVPLPPELKSLTAGVPGSIGRYNPSNFVDVVEHHHATASPDLRVALVAVQRLEWIALFNDCWRAAAG